MNITCDLPNESGACQLHQMVAGQIFRLASTSLREASETRAFYVRGLRKINAVLIPCIHMFTGELLMLAVNTQVIWHEAELKIKP